MRIKADFYIKNYGFGTATFDNISDCGYILNERWFPCSCICSKDNCYNCYTCKNRYTKRKYLAECLMLKAPKGVKLQDISFIIAKIIKNFYKYQTGGI